MLRSRFTRVISLVVTTMFLSLALSLQASAQVPVNNSPQPEPPSPVWQYVAETAVSPRGPLHTEMVSSYQTVVVDQPALQTILAKAPLEFIPQAAKTAVTLPLPLPDGTLLSFAIVESPIMEEALAARYPNIKTYAGYSLDNPAITMRLDWSPAGLNAIILAPDSTYFVQPYQSGDSRHHITYNYADRIQPTMDEDNLEESPEFKAFKQRVASPQAAPYTVGDTLRLYRIAVAATGEFAQTYGGGTVSGTVAAIVTRLNQVNAAYERDLAVRLILIAESEQVIYLNGATDPYTNNNLDAMLSENPTNLNSVIGADKFDIGHVFAESGGGGKAQLGSVCGSGKAVGASGSGADFYILAHELGHQFGAGHVQNTNNTTCNRAATSAWEPGSGVTIMSYNGVCDSLGPSTQNFNVGSFQQMMSFIEDGNGGSCGYALDTDNTAPVVDAGSTGFSIPINTPFALVGTATDAEGDTLTYSWEQHDLGAEAAVGDQPAGETVPLVRVDPPKETGVRFIPRTAVVTAGLPDPDNAELLPAFARSLTFRLQVRDNHAGVGGVAYDEITFNAVNTGATFQVTSPNNGTESWATGGNETVTWNVANTNQAPISCSQVNIDLSIDGGQNYPYNLATNTPNDGSHTITVPTIPTTLFARVRVACSELPDHFFYDVSDNNFTSGTINTTCAANVVTNISDSGACTLRQHIADATAGDTITFDPAIAGQTIHLASEIFIDKNLTIDGGNNNITISGDTDNNGDPDTRLFNTTAGQSGHLIFRNLTLTKGTGSNGGLISISYWHDLSIYNSTLRDGYADSYGGAIYSLQATVNIYNSSFINNEAGSGGALLIAYDTANIYNSTFSGNRARFWDGGGVYGAYWSSSPSTINLTNSTFYNNHADDNGGGVFISGSAILNMTNTLIAGSTSGGDCVIGAAPTTNTNNWVEDGGCSAANSGDPLVGSLGFNGGPTETHPLLAGSGAINSGNATSCSNVNLNGQDQRGYSHNGTCDIGAFEYNGTEAYGSNDAPTIANQAFSVNEASAPGSVVGTITASDSDNLAFSIVGGNTNNTFSVNSSTGQLAVQSNGSLTAGATFNLTVKALDDGTPNLASFATMTVTVNDINLAPTINAQAFTVSSSAGEGVWVGTAVSTDPDNDNLTFAITAGNTGSAFLINSLTGDITVANPAALSNAPFSLTVQVTDDGSPTQNDTATITVSVTNCPTASVVTSPADSGLCTLRQAIADATAGDTITFDTSIAGQTIRLNTEIGIDKNLTIDGSGQNITISGDGNNDGTGDTRIFNMGSGHLILRELTLTKGRVDSGNGGLISVSAFDTLSIYDSTLSDGYAYSYGGAIYNQQGTVNLYNSTVVNNEAGGGGGIFVAFEDVNIYNSTISGNRARWWNGGGVDAASWSSGGIIRVVNSTVYNNQAPGSNGGGIRSEGSSELHLTNALIGGSPSGGDCVADSALVTNVSNWVQDGGCSAGSSGNPMVTALADNDGTTQTHALQSGSGAINSGNAAACATAEIDSLDQRDHMRNDSQCDIGAFEYGTVSATAVWDGGGTTNNWSEAANWVGDVVPIAANNVVFNSTSSKDAVVDASFGGTVKSLTLATGYTGEVLLARSLTVSSSVSVGNGATLHLAGQMLTTEALVDNQGTIKDTRSATAVSTPVTFATIKNAANNATQYYGLIITPTGGSLGNVTVAIRGNQSRCTLSGSDAIIHRCFDITPDNSQAATIRFYFSEAERNKQAANGLLVWHFNGSSWDAAGNALSYSERDLVCVNGSGHGCWVEATSISSYSPFTLGSASPPTTNILNLAAPTLSIGFVGNTLTASWTAEANSCGETNVYTSTSSPYSGFSTNGNNLSGNSWNASGTEGNPAINTFYYIQELHCPGGSIFQTNTVGEFDYPIVPGS